jgi:hypothetical protein
MISEEDEDEGKDQEDFAFSLQSDSHSEDEEGHPGSGIVHEPETEEEAAIREMAEMESMHGAIASTEYDSELHQDDSGVDDTIAIRFLESFRGLSSRFDSQSSSRREGATTGGGMGGIPRPIRELYPRLGWHDVHAKIIGLPARDISSHFIQVPFLPSLPFSDPPSLLADSVPLTPSLVCPVSSHQRWNYHRASKNKTDKVILLDVTDNPNFGQCAACQERNISETFTRCPRCGYALGSCSPYFATRSLPVSNQQNDPSASFPAPCYAPLRLPELPTTFSFIDFEFTLKPHTGLVLSGDGPVGIESLVPCSVLGETTTAARAGTGTGARTAGVLKHSQGREFPSLIERGLTPCVGDLLILVDEISVSHLSTTELIKFIEDRGATKPTNHVIVLFRRFYLHELDSLYRNLSLSLGPYQYGANLPQPQRPPADSPEATTSSPASSQTSLPSSRSKDDLTSHRSAAADPTTAATEHQDPSIQPLSSLLSSAESSTPMLSRPAAPPSRPISSSYLPLSRSVPATSPPGRSSSRPVQAIPSLPQDSPPLPVPHLRPPAREDRDHISFPIVPSHGILVFPEAPSHAPAPGTVRCEVGRQHPAELANVSELQESVDICDREIAMSFLRNRARATPSASVSAPAGAPHSVPSADEEVEL